MPYAIRGRHLGCAFGQSDQTFSVFLQIHWLQLEGFLFDQTADIQVNLDRLIMHMIGPFLFEKCSAKYNVTLF